MWRKSILIVPVLLALGGYGTVLPSRAETVPSGTPSRSVQNPVTRDTLLRVESGLRVAVVGLQTYKNYCQGRPAGDRCEAVVVQLQGYSRLARPLVRQLRVFVRKNDQVNARVVFETLRGIFAQFQATAAREGITVPSIGG